jgi:hypothetical protein
MKAFGMEHECIATLSKRDQDGMERNSKFNLSSLENDGDSSYYSSASGMPHAVLPGRVFTICFTCFKARGATDSTMRSQISAARAAAAS